MGTKKFLKRARCGVAEIVLMILLGFIFFMGGFGTEVLFWSITGGLFGMCLLLVLIITRGTLKFPPHFYLYSLFLTLFILSFAGSVNYIESLRYFLLFLAGWAFWLFFYNAKLDVSVSLQKLILFLGVAFGVLFLVKTLYNVPLIRGLSLFLTPSAHGNHNHIGDFWAVVSVILVYKLSKKPKAPLIWLLSILAIFFLAASLSRAAYLSLAVGVIYLGAKERIFEKFIKQKKLATIFIVIFVAIFFLAATRKGIILSRPYFIQSLAGLKFYPLGVGMGNFGTISSDTRTHIFGLSGFSSYTHNVVLEAISGMGILGFVFLFWFINVAYDALTGKMKASNLFAAIFLTLCVNFFFDYTYFISTMNWLWFVSLGLGQRK